MYVDVALPCGACCGKKLSLRAKLYPRRRTGDGSYWINLDGNTAFESYCNMTTDGGGWTLLTNGGGSCQSFSCSTATMSSLSSISSTDTCSYLEESRVALIAANGQT
ncbi:MAG: hypothetical protein CL916_13890 [Deltaproteobacteria bacterium]|nr:hypothetical protein [Deltaproteobacteria bacterium]